MIASDAAPNSHCAMLTKTELRAAAATLTEIADALDEQETSK